MTLRVCVSHDDDTRSLTLYTHLTAECDEASNVCVHYVSTLVLKYWLFRELAAKKEGKNFTDRLTSPLRTTESWLCEEEEG